MVSDPPLILAFDTSAARCAAALVQGERTLASRVEAMDRGQAERLLPLIEALLGEAGVAWRDLSGVAVVTGPGNFTGIRIGVAAARGLALGLGVPAVGVTAFAALAAPRGPSQIAIRERRGQIFVQAFVDGEPLAPPEPVAAAAQLLDESELAVDCTLVARIAARALGAAPPPAPLYLRPADAMLPSEAPPVLIDDA